MSGHRFGLFIDSEVKRWCQLSAVGVLCPSQFQKLLVLSLENAFLGFSLEKIEREN